MKRYVTKVAIVAWCISAAAMLFQGCELVRPNNSYQPPSAPITNQQQYAAEVAKAQAAFPTAVTPSGTLDLAAVSNLVYNTPSRLEAGIVAGKQVSQSVPDPYREPITAALLIAGLVAQTIRHGAATKEIKRLALLVPPDTAPPPEKGAKTV